jgi:hypothetical protein
MSTIKDGNAFRMIRDADVTVEQVRGEKNYPVAIATINGGELVHEFDRKSRVSKALEMSTPEDIAARLSGGDFFITQDGELVDFRYGAYKHMNGFVHSDESIQQLAEVIGYTETDHRNNLISGDVSLRSTWSEHDIIVPELGEGGNFESALNFSWSPFSEHVRSSFDIMRLICTNGMTGMSPLLNTKIPLINRWEEHLDIANAQIQTKLENIITRRINEMTHDRATVAELMLIAEHATNRLDSSDHLQSKEQRDRLRKIRSIASPELHSPGEAYRANVFENKNLAAQMPGHLTVFDAWNMLTEMRSHTPESTKSSAHALDRMANRLIFDREDLANHAARYDNNGTKLAAFSDPDAAFFGTMNTDSIDGECEQA